ncbi:MAG: ArnT family glycosyltransferase [Cryomorphaceae bacterium]|nr:glycosyltransferase family 39 protein [Flavobacteriales bacterium]
MKERSKLFAAIALAVFIYVVLRAIFVPISHDEAVTYLLYVQRGHFLPHNMIWDANNHILNSVLMYPVYKIFGVHILSLRLPNVMAFPVYAFFIYKLLSKLRSHLVFYLGAMALLSAPLLLDFFAQARGYGISMATFAGGLYFMNRYFSTGLPKYQWFVWLFFSLTLAANMSMMNSYLIALGLIAVMAVRKFGFSNLKGHLLPYAIGGLLPFAGFSIYAMAMRQRGLLYYGEKDGFVEITVRLLNKFVFYSDDLFLARVVAVLGVIFGGYLIFLWVKRQLHSPDTGTISAVFLLGNAAGAILLCHLLEVNYPEDRTGLYFVPLFILAATFAFDSVVAKVPLMKFTALSLAVIPVLAITGGNIGYTRLWRELHIHPGLYEYIADRHPDDNTTVESYFLTATSWGYNTIIHNTLLSPIIPTRFANNRADYAICYRDRCDGLALTHDTVYKDPRNDIYLMKRNLPWEWEAFEQAEELLKYEGNDEFINFYVTEDSVTLARFEAMDLRLSVKSDAEPLLCDIVISARNENDKVIHYEFMALNWMREKWDGNTLQARRMVKLPEGSHKLVCYVWNMKEAEISVAFEEITLLESATE